MPLQKFLCGICSQAFTAVTLFIMHLENHENHPEKFRRKICSSNLLNLKIFKSHIRSHLKRGKLLFELISKN